jgi:hypothetical protein
VVAHGALGKGDPVAYIKERICSFPSGFHGQITMHDLPLKGAFVDVLEEGMAEASIKEVDIF